MSDLSDRTEQALDPTNAVKTSSRPDPMDEESLLKLPEAEAARRALKDWDESWRDIAKVKEQWKVNRARSQGYTGVLLIKKQDKNEAYIPYGAKKNVSGLNKAARLKRRIRSTLFGDPPMAEATPSGDDDEKRDQAEVATRVLQDVCSEGNLAYALLAGDAFDLGGDYGSGFLRFFVDETGGGWQPKQVEAHPQAQSAQDPKPLDPATGQPLPGDLILRYVTEDGQFTENPSEAARSWLPKLRCEVLTGKQVRFIPFGVRDIWEADGMQVGTAVPLGQLKAMFPDLQKWTPERIGKLIQTRPQHFKDILPPGQKDVQDNTNKSLVFVLTRYHVQSPLYPLGAYVIAAGADEILHRSMWYDEQHGEPMDVPITQFKQLTEEENPYGEGVMTGLGPGNELRGGMLGAMLEHLDRFNARRLFVPMTSTLQPHQLQSPTGTPIPILPGGEPKYEEIPDFPVIVEKMLAFSSADMDDESGLQQSGQGLNPPGVKSGLHAQTILEQVHQSLSDLRQNTERGLVRGWRIILQLIRAYFSVEQQIRWFGDDGRYKVRTWTNADLGSTRDVRIQRGSFTQLAPTAKAELAQAYYQIGLLSKPDLDHVIEGNIGGLFGLQDNPHRMRVRRQIATWNEGPPENWQPPQPPVDPMTMQSVVDPQTGQPMPPPPDQTLAGIFDHRPSDEEPLVAQLRAYELGRAMAGTKFTRHPPEWRQGIAEAYMAAWKASQLPDEKQAEAMQKQIESGQQELEATKEKLTQAQMKLQAPHLNLSLPLAEMDQAQTQAILAANGIQVPPGMDKQEPEELSPAEQIAHDERMQAMKLVSDMRMNREKGAVEIEKEKIRGAVKQHTESQAAKREKDVTDKVSQASKAPAITIALPEKMQLAHNAELTGLSGKIDQLHKAVSAPKEMEVVRDKKTGKVTGAKVRPAKEDK